MPCMAKQWTLRKCNYETQFQCVNRALYVLTSERLVKIVWYSPPSLPFPPSYLCTLRRKIRLDNLDTSMWVVRIGLHSIVNCQSCPLIAALSAQSCAP